MNWLKTSTLILLSAFLLVACGNNEESKSDVKAAEGTTEKEVEGKATFPTIVTMGEETVTIEDAPQRILPLSLDTAEILIDLIGIDRIAAISKSVTDPMISSHPEVGTEITERFASAVNIDPEQILAYDTDLLLLTKIHGQEADADKILSQAGIPILSFESITSVENYMNNIKIIGQAVGEEEKAEKTVETFYSDIEKVQQMIPDDANEPTVLVLSEVGPGTGPFIMGPTNISYDLIKLAGGVPVIDSINLDRTTKAEVEQVIKMDPDYIFLLDWQGNGEEAYADLMASPGWNTLQAVENNNTEILAVKYLMNPNRDNIEGLKMMTEKIHGLNK